MTSKVLTLAELDTRLDLLMATPEVFEGQCLTWIESLDRRKVALEVRDPETWRDRSRSKPVKLRGALEQLRADVETILTLDREEEARLARRIEFARLRLARARRAAGVEEDRLLEGVGMLAQQWFVHQATQVGPVQSRDRSARQAALETRVMERSAELHALRLEMVERNLYLVLINVERYAHSSTTRADLVQEGSAALFRAVDGFDWRRGLLFRTYAVHWLNQAFRNYLYNFTSTVRVPVYLHQAMKAIHQARVRLGDANASADQIAEVAELDVGLVASALGAARTSYSLDADLSDDGEGNRLRDLLVNDDSDGPYTPGIEDVTLEGGLGAAMAKLSEREQQVLRLRFGIGQQGESTLAEVAEVLGVSVERVRQIQVRAISKLDTPALRRELEPFLN